MKHPFKYIFTIIGVLTLSSLLTLIIGSTMTSADDTPDNVVETPLSDGLLAPAPLSKNETVYAITDSAGTLTKSFIGSAINTSSTPLPVALSIKYFLDGNEISAADLAGHSGHIRIEYHPTATSTYQGKLIPFLTVTGLTLDSHKFHNLNLENAKIINESDHLAIVGYAFAGLDEDLATDLIPSYFSLEADVTDFAISTTYTLATNEIIADLDTTKLTSLDGLIDSVNQLSDGLNQIVSGSELLTTNLDLAADGGHQLLAGVNTLTSGVATLTDGAHQLNDGAHQLADGLDQLSGGLDQVVAFHSGILDKVDSTGAAVQSKISKFSAEYDELIAKLTAEYNELATEYPELAEKYPNLSTTYSTIITRLTEAANTVNDYYNQAHSAVTTYTDGIAALADGAHQLRDGAHQLADGTSQLVDGTTALTDGVKVLSDGSTTLSNGLDQLAAGSHTLTDGLHTFKSAGIDRLVSFANNDIDSLLRNLRATVIAADSYHHYNSPSAHSVKFIFKTPSIK